MADNLKELIQKYNSINNIIRDLIDGYADNQLKKKTVGKEISGQDFSWAAFSKDNDDLNLNKEEILRNIMDFLSKEKASKKIYHYGIRQEDFPDDFDSLFEFIGKNIDIKPEAFESLKEDMRLYLKDIKSLDSFWNESVQNLIQNYIENFDVKAIKQNEYPDAEVEDNKIIDSHGTVEIKDGVNFRKLDVMNADAGENFLKENRWVRPWFNSNLTTYEFVRNNDIMMNAITSDKELQFTRKQSKKINSNRENISSAPEPPHIYGVSWNFNGKILSRTDDAELFSDPIPFVNNGMTAEDCSSPFDNLMPWKGMVRTVDNIGNELVAIPKFWCKIEKTNQELKVQIANGPVDGFFVSPAHKARNNEEEDKEIIYIGRYHSNSSYKSISESIPTNYKIRSYSGQKTHNLGENYWQLDIRLWQTIQMLYLVEFANWDSQAMIGYGCNTTRNAQLTGSTDNMPYHTGTMQSSKNSYGIGVQYRWIEDLWGNVWDWCDGITFRGKEIYIFNNFEDYDDEVNAEATQVGNLPMSSNYIKDFNVSSQTNYEWFVYPSKVQNSQTEVPDLFYYSNSGKVLYVGGGPLGEQEYGLFFSATMPAYTTSPDIGIRLQYRP